MPLRLASLASLMPCVGLLALTAPTWARSIEGRAHAVPLPAWVDPQPADPRAADVRVAADEGVVWLLSDRQLRAAATPERYARRAFRVDGTTGIETISELHLDYDPSFEKLSLHFVHILRDGQVIDALKSADWKVIEPESDRDRRIYSGELEGLLFLHDVRVGDVIDYAYTIAGDNPVLDGHFAQQLSLDEGTGVVDLRRRIVTDEARPLSFKGHGEASTPVETVSGGVREITWRRTNAAASDDEDRTPSWFRSEGWVDVSDFASWNEVAAASAALFEAGNATSPELTANVAKWRELPTEQARAVAATRFVQDEIRYLGIEIGPHTHQPFPASTVLQRRFGDCKDKSLLLVTLLRALGISADPALVNTHTRRKLDELLPSPFAFDHAIVRAVIEGRTTFIDATASLQRGPLAERQPPPYERALVVSRDTQGLVPIDLPPPKVPTFDVDEAYHLTPPGGGPPQLIVVTTFRGDDADDMRDKLASTPRSDLSRHYLNYYAATYPAVRALRDPTFDDDPDGNVIVVREQYEVPDFWDDGARELSPAALEHFLKAPKISRRQMPLGVEFPDFVAAHIHVEQGPSHPSLPEDTNERDGAVRFHSHARFESGVLTLDYEYEALADVVDVGKVPAHLSLLDRVDKAWSYTLQAESLAPAKVAPVEPLPGWAWWTGGGLVAFGVVAWLGREAFAWTRRREFRKRAVLERGEAPTTPITVVDEAEIDVRLGRTGCVCKARLARTPGAGPTTRLRLGDRTILAVEVACLACGSAKRMYFELKGS